MSKIIYLNKISKYFNKTKVIDDLSFEVEQGEIFGIVGPDGAGKTTTVRMIAGIIDADSGSISIDKNIIGYMPQRFNLYEDLSVEENINFFADLYSIPHKDRVNRMEDLYRFSHLEEFKNRLAQNLSGGMQKKLALTCALINFPKILILDEPTIGVDPLSRQELWEMLINLNKKRNITILVTTSYMDEIEKCDRVGLLYQGRFLLCDSISNIMKRNIPFEEIFISEINKINNKHVFSRS